MEREVWATRCCLSEASLYAVFTRSLKYALWFYDWLFEHPAIRLMSIYDSVDLQTPDGYFTSMLSGLLSELEILINKCRSRIGIERAKKEGKYRGGRGRPWLKGGPIRPAGFTTSNS